MSFNKVILSFYSTDENITRVVINRSVLILFFIVFSLFFIGIGYVVGGLSNPTIVKEVIVEKVVTPSKIATNTIPAKSVELNTNELSQETKEIELVPANSPIKDVVVEKSNDTVIKPDNIKPDNIKTDSIKVETIKKVPQTSVIIHAPHSYTPPKYFSEKFKVEEKKVINNSKGIEINFLLTRKNSGRAPLAGDLKIQFLDQAGQVLFEGPKEEFKFKSGRYTNILAPNLKLDNVKYVHLIIYHLGNEEVLNLK